MDTEKLKAILRQLILENEGNRDDILYDMYWFLKPIFERINELTEPSGVLDPLTHANNTIEAMKAIVSKLFDDINY